MKIQSVLISQAPSNGKHSFENIEKSEGIRFDFKSFVEVESVDKKIIAEQKINFNDFSAIIFTSRHAVDHYFKMAELMRYKVPDDMKFFCISEAIAYYLQNYVVYRKRKIFVGVRRIDDLVSKFKKHQSERFLLPCSNIQSQNITNVLKKHKLNYTPVVLFNMVCAKLAPIKQDLIIFYSPASVDAFVKNFPDFKQNNTKFAAFGNATQNALKKAKFKIDIQAPTPEAPSMVRAVSNYIKQKSC